MYLERANVHSITVIVKIDCQTKYRKLLSLDCRPAARKILDRISVTHKMELVKIKSMEKEKVCPPMKQF